MDGIQYILDTAYLHYPSMFWLLSTVLGGVMGSFLTCMLYRVPNGISLSQPPSYCPSCKATLKAVDLVPVFSYMLTKGRCRHCHSPVSPRYVCIELLTIFGFLSVFYVIGLSLWLLLAWTCLISCLFVALLWLESRLVARKVLLFSITLFVVLCLGVR